MAARRRIVLAVAQPLARLKTGASAHLRRSSAETPGFRAETHCEVSE